MILIRAHPCLHAGVRFGTQACQSVDKNIENKSWWMDQVRDLGFGFV
jgi:hypothetical protein